jgi:predicted protein tyrosine phosphatase
MQIISNELSFIPTPKNSSELKSNQNARHEALCYFSSGAVQKHSQAKVRQFWATQAFFMIKYIRSNLNRLPNLPSQLQDDLQKNAILKKTIINTFAWLEKQLDNREFAHALISIISDDCFAPLNGNMGEQVMAQKPRLHIYASDSICFAQEAALQGKKVFICDAANSQRPGEGAYKNGTYQEALTRWTDLYIKIMVHFRDVAEDLLQTENTEQVLFSLTDQDRKIAVSDYQARYLKLITHFIYVALTDDNFVDNTSFTNIFCNFADKIYSDMQNKVLEIPAGGGFIKHCTILSHPFSDINALFVKDVLQIDLIDKNYPRVSIAEIAAPDKRPIVGRYDRGCTYSYKLNHSDEDKIANQMIVDSLHYALTQAELENADYIILNAFGCGAFLNNENEVADNMAKVLFQHAKKLENKEIYFIDLDKDKCWTFAKTLTQELSDSFNINPFELSNVTINVLPAPIITKASDREFIIKSYSSAVTGNKDLALENKVKTKPLTKADLSDAYFRLLSWAMLEKKSIVHTPLIGSGKLDFNSNDCLDALMDAVNKISKQDLILPKINLYLIEKEKYLTAMKLLCNKKIIKLTDSQLSQLKKYYSVTLPTMAKSATFTFGLGKSHIYEMTRDFKASSKISDNLYLGRTLTSEESKDFKNTHPKLSMVVSVLESFELQNMAQNWPVINHYQLSVEDTQTEDFSLPVLIDIVKRMKQHVDSGNTVYVHCKAGMSRSATVIVLFLYLYDSTVDKNPGLLEKEYERLRQWLKKIRPQTSLHDCHLQVIKQAVNYIKAEMIESTVAALSNITDPTLEKRISNYIASFEAKMAIMQLPAFKCIRASAFADRSKLSTVNSLLEELLYLATPAHLQLLLLNKNKLYQSLYDEIIECVASNLKLSTEEIKQVVEIGSCNEQFEAKDDLPSIQLV